MPRRRRGAKAVAVEAEAERGLLMRALLHSPKDMLAAALAVAAIGAILTNALFLQAGRHPSPMFGSSVVTLPAPTAAVVLPRPRPVELAARPDPALFEPKPVEFKSAEPKAAESRTSEPKAVDAKATDPKATDPMTSLVVKSTSSAPLSNAAKPTNVVAIAPSNVMRPPA